MNFSLYAPGASLGNDGNLCDTNEADGADLGGSTPGTADDEPGIEHRSFPSPQTARRASTTRTSLALGLAASTTDTQSYTFINLPASHPHGKSLPATRLRSQIPALLVAGGHGRQWRTTTTRGTNDQRRSDHISSHCPERWRK
ncbi:MAG: hypothetical protein U5M50_00480 [Sphingobium sp.]|nr:hypothetical protein [Sphingobium sp.]